MYIHIHICMFFCIHVQCVYVVHVHKREDQTRQHKTGGPDKLGGPDKTGGSDKTGGPDKSGGLDYI